MEDVSSIAALGDDLEVARWLARLPHPYCEVDARAFVKASDEVLRQGRGHNLVLDLDGEAVGIVGIEGVDGPEPEIGWWLGRPHWGQGLMSEAVEAVLEALFAAGMARCRAGVFAGNARSLRVQEKMGFVITGESVRYCAALGRDLAHIDTILTRENFLRRPGRERRA